MKFRLFLLILLIPINVLALTYPNINSKYAIIYDKTDDTILYEKKADEISSIASLTKIATTITAIENISNLKEEVVITRDILNTVSPEASIAGLKVGDKLTYEDLLYASMLPSGADATNALAILSSGSINNFVKNMNELAEKIGLSNTHFVNVTGLDADGHYSTTRDVLKLLSYSLDNEYFKNIYTTKDYILSNNLKVKSTLYLYNRDLNKDISKVLGSKTGYTKKAGYCISSLSRVDNHDIIIVLLNAPSEEHIAYHIIDDLNLIDFIDNNYGNQILFSKDFLIRNIQVELSNIDFYTVYVENEIVKFLPNDYDRNKVTYRYEGKDILSYKDKVDDNIGSIYYYYDDTPIYSQNVILKDRIKFSFKKLLMKYYFLLIIIFICITLFGIKKSSHK